MNQNKFWNMPFIKDQQEIQKCNPYGSESHRNAELAMKEKCAEIMGEDFANEYFGEY